jgi:hypothetical protein
MRLERVIDFQNIGPGKTAIMTLPLGPTYEAVHIDLNGTLEVTDIATIIGRIDNKPFWTITGDEVLKQINYDGYGLPVDKLTLDFTLPNAKSQGGQGGATAQSAEILLTCLPSAVMQSLTFEIKLKSDAPAGSAMTALMQISEPTNNPYILKQYEANYSLAAANTHSLLLPTGDAGGMLQKLFIHKSSGAGAITAIELKNNGVTLVEATPEEIKYIQSTYYGKVQQTDLLVLDFHLQGMRSKLFNTVMGKNTYMKVTTDGACNLNIYSRFIDPINRK